MLSIFEQFQTTTDDHINNCFFRIIRMLLTVPKYLPHKQLKVTMTVHAGFDTTSKQQAFVTAYSVKQEVANT